MELCEIIRRASLTIREARRIICVESLGGFREYR